MIFNKGGKLIKCSFSVNDYKLECVKEYKYLGLLIGCGGNFSIAISDLDRDRPFNLKGFLFRSEFFFRTTQELEYFIHFQNFTLGYMTKTLNHIIFFPLHQNQNIFFSNIGNQNIFLEKNHNPPLQVKWSFPYRNIQIQYRLDIVFEFPPI